ncbi:MAG: radical SAM protein [Candidatus Omnitrophota bacterium]
MPVNMEPVNFTRFKEPSSIRNVALLLTTRCPLSCRYCFLNRTQPDMPEDVLKKSIDLLFTSPEKKVELQFFGGEPLMRFDLIQKALYYAGQRKRATGKRITYLLTTNGLLLDEEKIGFLTREKVEIMVSIDGARLTQLKNRPMIGGNKEYFNTVLRNIGLLNKHKARYFVSMVVLSEDIPLMRKNIDFLIKKGIRRIWIAYALGQKYSRQDFLGYITELGFLLKSVHGHTARIINFDVDCEPVFYCPQISITASGSIYIGCALVLERAYPELNRIFYFGKLDDCKDLTALKMTKGKQAAIIRRYARSLHQKFMHILYMGIAAEFLYKFNHLRQEYSLFEKQPRAQSIHAGWYRSFGKVSLMIGPGMREDVLKKSIDMLFTSSQESFELEFSGAEPLAHFEMIKAALSYVQQKKKSSRKQVSCTLVTGGLFLDEDKINFLLRHRVLCLLKIGGGIHASVKNIAFKRQISGLIKLLKKNGSDFGVIQDVPFLHLEGFEEDISFLIKQGVRKIRFSYDPGILYDASSVACALVSLFKISRDLYFRKGVSILNCGIPGVFGAASTDITVDGQGKVYLCGNLVFSKRFRRLKEASLIGDVGWLRHNKIFLCDLDTALLRVINVYKRGSRKKEIVVNSLMREELFREFFHSEMYFPIKQPGCKEARCLI